jgi:glycosyltransferase involved in cell wall biosynthesis
MTYFSVIIPNYNHAAFLEERMLSVLQQTYQHFEIILLDDASTDNSAEHLRRYASDPRVTHLLINEKNSGSPFRQWAAGIGIARGEWIWIAESDDQAHPEFLATVAAAIDKQQEASLIYTDAYIVERGKITGNFSHERAAFLNTLKWNNNFVETGDRFLNDYLKYHNTINNASNTVFKKSAALPFLQTLTTYTYFGDWWLYQQLCTAGSVGYIATPLSRYRRHAGNHTGERASNAHTRVEYFRILRSLLQNGTVTDKEKLTAHFMNHYLTYKLFRNGPVTAAKIMYGWLRQEPLLGMKTVMKILWKKLLR